MPRYDPHPVLDPSTAECLRLLADPELSPKVLLPKLDEQQAAMLIRAAVVHGTLSVARRNVRSRVSGSPSGVSRALVSAFEEVEPRLLMIVGQTMHLRHWGERIVGEFREDGVNCAIVKGPIFAARLYPHPTDRIYTDVDIVIDQAGIERAFAILDRLGFAADDIPNHDSAAHCEFKFVLRSSGAVHVELQTNLIHSARTRHGISVDLSAICGAGDGDPHDATALLFVATVHAALGHQFERLELLVDVMQSVRGRGGAFDPERLARIARQSGTLRAVAGSLALAGQMYDEPDCAALARWLMPGPSPLEWRLVTPGVVLKAQSRAGRGVAWRRKLFRQLIRRPTPRRSGEGPVPVARARGG